MSRSSFRRLPALVLATVASGFVFGAAFPYEALAAPVLVAAVVPASAVAVLRRLRPAWGPEVDLPLLAVLGCMVGTALLFHDVLTAQGLLRAAREAASAEAGVWSRLGVSLPASADADALVAPFSLTWAVTVAAVELRLRAEAGALALLPPTGAMVVGMLMCAPQTAGGTVPAIVFAIAVAADLAKSDGDRLSRGSQQRWGTATLATGCVVLATTLLTSSSWLTERLPYDIVRRTGGTAPSALDPLAQAAAWASRPRETLFRATGAAPTTWVLADLDRYDGVAWQPSGRFVSAASLSYLSESRPAASDVSATDVRVEGMTGPYLPLPKHAVSVEGVPVTVSRHDGTVLAQHPLRRGSRYRASVPRQPDDPNNLDDVLVPDLSDPTTLAVPVNVPADLAKLVSVSTSALPSSATSYQRVGALARRLTSHYTYRTGEAADQTLGGAARLLATGQGSAAAFATVFALGARQLGAPTRVAVGFTAGSGHRDGSRSFTGADVEVWGEVRFVGLGWLPFDILPRPTTGPAAAVPLPTRRPPSPTATPTATSSPSRLPSPTALPIPPYPTPTGVTGQPERNTVSWTALLTVLGVATLTAVAWPLVFAPRLRRRRARRRPTPAGRVEGAWEVTTAQLARRRLLARRAPRLPQYLADALRPEAQEALAPQLTALGVLTTQARYGEPDADEAQRHPYWPRMSDADADGAWQLEAEITDRCRALVRQTRARALRRLLRRATDPRTHVMDKQRQGGPR
ncbi:transglutaminaseTgpA domain-containing protein (plasmid) [Streptomyces sp. C1-1]|uniref:DUF3488 and transglutaminase-like domain-containing protein n=1 Tax=Streptomyces sp. C1-1 TaxID=3231173 RepID=UPI003CFF6E5B